MYCLHKTIPPAISCAQFLVVKQVLLGRSQRVRLDLCMQGTPAVPRLPGGVGCDGSRLTVSKHGLQSRFPELSEQILLRGEIPSFNRCGIPQLFNMKSFWEEERGSDPVPATGDFCRPNFTPVQLCPHLWSCTMVEFIPTPLHQQIETHWSFGFSDASTGLVFCLGQKATT